MPNHQKSQSVGVQAKRETIKTPPSVENRTKKEPVKMISEISVAVSEFKSPQNV